MHNSAQRIKVVGFLTHNNRGGAQTAMGKLQNNVDKSKFRFVVVYLYSKEGSVMDNGEVLVCGKHSKIYLYLMVIIKLFIYFHKNRLDVSLSFLPLANVIVSILAKLYGVKTIIISHRNPVWTYNKFLKLIDKLIGSIGLYSAVIANSNEVKSSFESYPLKYKKLISIVNNGITNQEIVESDARIRNKLGLPRSGKLIVSIGRLSEQKKYNFSIDVIKEVPDVNYIIAGHGEKYNELREKVKNLSLEKRVCFLGNLTQIDVLCLLKVSDIFMQTTIYEGQSNALLEAISSGCVIVSSDIDAQREVLTDIYGLNCGILIKGFNVDEWKNNISLLLENKTESKLLRARATARSKDYTIEKMVNGFSNIINICINNS